MTNRDSANRGELLPLPNVMQQWAGSLRREAEDYARACVERALAESRAEVERLRELIRPKREEECMTLDHWRMRAYDLEANWSQCSRHCNQMAGERDHHKARAERLADRLTELAAECRGMEGLGSEVIGARIEAFAAALKLEPK